MPRLEDFTPGAQVKGILAGSPVTVVSVKWHGSNALVLTYKDGERKPDVTLLYRDNDPALEILQPGRHRKFSKCLAADEAKDAVGGFINLIQTHTVGPGRLLPWIESRDCRSLWFQRDQRAYSTGGIC